MVKCDAVIGLKEPIAWISILATYIILGTYKKTRFWTNHSAVFDHVRQTTEFRQTAV